jgi:hypothetical protein
MSTLKEEFIEKITNRLHSRNKNAEQTDVRDAILETIDLMEGLVEALREDLASPTPVVVTPGGPYNLQVPAGTFVRGDRAVFHITPEGNQPLTLSEGIAVPSDSAIVFPKTLTGGQLYIAQLTYSGSAWLLTSLVGGY